MKHTLLCVTAGIAVWSAACSSGNGVINPPPPAGKYSLGSLSGTYAFVTNGEVFTNGATAPSSLARVGSFIADGKGNITGGMEDISTDGRPSNAIAIVGGSYTVSSDGRGGLALNFQGGATVDLGIVLTSTGDGLLIDETSNANQASTGSGNFILQQSTPFTLGEITGSYVFDFTGFDAAQPNPNPESFIGEFTADGNTGTIPTGSFDDNVGGSLTSGGMTPGAISQDPGNISTFTNFGRGIATIAGQNFVFYLVDSNRVRFLSTNNGMLSGDAIAQKNVPASLNSSFVFVAGGSSPNGGLTRVGRFTASGSAVTNILMDVNDAGFQRQPNSFSNASATFDPTTGRGTVTFQDSSSNIYTFVFYLNSQNSGVIQDISPSGTLSVARNTADGSIELQSGSPFTSVNISGSYAMNWSGLVVAGGTFPVEDEEDLLAQMSVSNLAIGGTADSFQFTSTTLTPLTNKGLAGSINFNGGNGTSDDQNRNFMNLNFSNTAPIDMVVYFVNPQLAFFANRDNSGTQRIVAGVLKAQQ